MISPGSLHTYCSWLAPWEAGTEEMAWVGFRVDFSQLFTARLCIMIA